MNKIGRNDPCPCGSGKKYKKCCLAQDQASRPRGGGDASDKPHALDGEEPFIAELRPDLDEKVDRLMARLEAGEGRAVEPEIKALLQKNPRYHSTLFAMGVYLAMVMKDSAGAIPFFEKAVKIFPPFSQAHYNLAIAARQTGNIVKAVESLRAAMRYSRDDDGIAEMAGKELRFLERILVEGSPFANLEAYMANAKLFEEAFECLTNRDFAKAAELFKRVLSENSKHVQSYGNLGLAYAGLGRRADAMECFDQALALDPEYEPAISNRRVTEQMREGEPFIAGGMRETDYYVERLKEQD